MSDLRRDQIAQFLGGTEWADATIKPLAGDASNRRYFRLHDDRRGDAVLMDAPPETGEDTAPFIAIAAHLIRIGLSAPETYESDPKQGFLILEDLGDDLFSRVLKDQPELEETLYMAAIDALIAAQDTAGLDDLPQYATAEMTAAAGLALVWYIPHAAGAAPKQAERDLFLNTLERALRVIEGPAVLVQRDYHAENLLWLPDRAGAARVGLLDFQDAALGHPAYDLASLLVDVRRDVSPQVRAAGIAHYLARTGREEAAFRKAFATLSAQRNLRIIGVFARLCLRDGKPHYPDMLPQVWRNLLSDLSHPALAELRDVVTALMPEPTESIIAGIKANRKASHAG